MPFLNVNIFDDLPLRLKHTVNPYVKRLTEAREQKRSFMAFGSELKGLRGQWRANFERKLGRPVDKLILEIGIHKGKVLQSLASDHPELGFIGMDITMKRVVLSADALEENGSKNA